MFAKPKLSAGVLLARTVVLALAACLLSSPEATAAPKDKKKQPTTGRIEISTDPGGYPITIDGQPAGETADYVRAIELDPGPHTVEVGFPDGTHWSQAFQIVAGRKNCVALKYRPRTIEVPATGDATDARAETFSVGDIMGSVCDCGEIPALPISKVPWWKRAAGKLKPK